MKLGFLSSWGLAFVLAVFLSLGSTIGLLSLNPYFQVASIAGIIIAYVGGDEFLLETLWKIDPAITGSTVCLLDDVWGCQNVW